MYVNEGLPEDLDKCVRGSSSPTVTDFWGVGGESLRVHSSVKEGSGWLLSPLLHVLAWSGLPPLKPRILHSF